MAKKGPVINNYHIGELDVETKIDYDKLAEAIVKATAKLEEAKQEREEERKQEIISKRREILKEKDFSHINCRVWRAVRTFLNNLRVLWRILTLSRDNAKYFTAFNGLTRLLSSLLLFFIELAFYACSGFVVLKILLERSIAVEYIPLVWVPIMLARFIRIARLEIDRIENENQLMNIAMLLVAFVTLTATIIGTMASMNIIGG